MSARVASPLAQTSLLRALESSCVSMPMMPISHVHVCAIAISCMLALRRGAWLCDLGGACVGAYHRRAMYLVCASPSNPPPSEHVYV